MRKHGRIETFFGCDAWIYEGYDDYSGTKEAHIDGRPDISRQAYMAHIKTSFITSTRLLSEKYLPSTFHMTSDEFFNDWNSEAVLLDVFDRKRQLGGSISFCYLDGDHAYEYAKRDFENAAGLMRPGGFILLDDSEDGSTLGSARLAKEIAKDEAFKLIARNPNHLFQKVALMGRDFSTG